MALALRAAYGVPANAVRVLPAMKPQSAPDDDKALKALDAPASESGCRPL